MRSSGQFQNFLLLFFFTEIFYTHKKAQKAQRWNQAKAEKSQKRQKVQRRNEAKAQIANKRISYFFPLRCFYAHFLFLFTCKRFVLFVFVKSFR